MLLAVLSVVAVADVHGLGHGVVELAVMTAFVWPAVAAVVVAVVVVTVPVAASRFDRFPAAVIVAAVAEAFDFEAGG